MSRRLRDAPSDEDQVPWDQADTNIEALDEAHQDIESNSRPDRASLRLHRHCAQQAAYRGDRWAIWGGDITRDGLW
jgi:hypothetical protein